MWPCILIGFKGLGFRLFGDILGLYWDNGEENGSYYSIGCILRVPFYVSVWLF